MNRGPPGLSLPAKIAAVIAGSVLLVLGVMFSLVILAGAAVLGVVLWLYLWWKTRALRAAMREQAARGPAQGGDIIEGEAVVVEERSVTDCEVLPARDDAGGEARR